MKEYPLRNRVNRYKLCDCGHNWGDHGFRYLIFSNGACNECMCPKFNHIGWDCFGFKYHVYSQWIEYKEEKK